VSAHSVTQSSITPWAPIVAFAVIVVGILDAVSTNAGLLAGAVEVNPLMAYAQETLGSWWVLPKIGLQLFVAALVLMRPARMVFACVGAVVAFNAIVVLNNLALAGTL
jgi:hypothetical protein